jgi:hypothetical protein
MQDIAINWTVHVVYTLRNHHQQQKGLRMHLKPLKFHLEPKERRVQLDSSTKPSQTNTKFWDIPASNP